MCCVNAATNYARSRNNDFCITDEQQFNRKSWPFGILGDYYAFFQDAVIISALNSKHIGLPYKTYSFFNKGYVFIFVNHN